MACMGASGSGDPPRRNEGLEDFPGADEPGVDVDADGNVIHPTGDTIEYIEIEGARIPNEHLKINGHSTFTITMAETELTSESRC